MGRNIQLITVRPILGGTRKIQGGFCGIFFKDFLGIFLEGGFWEVSWDVFNAEFLNVFFVFCGCIDFLYH